MPNNRSVITCCTIKLFPFTLSISSNQPSSVVSIKLTAFYNFNSPKPNKSASQFGERIKRLLVTLTAFIRAFYPASWLYSPLATLFLKIVLLATKTSLLALPPSKVIIPLLCYVPLLLILLLFHQFFLLYLLRFDISKMISNGFSKPFEILNLLLFIRLLHQLLSCRKAIMKGCLRPGSHINAGIKFT